MKKIIDSSDDIEINLTRYSDVLRKRRVTFWIIFLMIPALMYFKARSNPKMYRVIMMIQPSITSESFEGSVSEQSVQSAENLRVLIANDAFNPEVSKKMDPKPDEKFLDFDAATFPNSDIVKVSITCEEKKRELGRAALNALFDVIYERYTKHNEDVFDGVSKEIEQNDRAILKGMETIDTLEQQVALLDEHARELQNFLGVLDKKVSHGSGGQKVFGNNVDGLIHLNGQATDIVVLKADLVSRVKDIDFEVALLQAKQSKLEMNKPALLCPQMIAAPRTVFISARSARSLFISSLLLGLLCAATAVFLAEFWGNTIRRRALKKE
jgi:hypothetical protein